jgi:hypothetical protein
VGREGYGVWTPGVLPGQHDAPRLQDVPQVGRAVSVSARGVLVEIDGQRGVVYGPAPWCLGSYDTAALALAGGFCPRAGDRVLLVFAGVGVETPVVVSWWR